MSHAAKLLDLAIAHHQAGRQEDAEKAYRKLLRLEPAHSDGLRLLGGLYLSGQQWDKAIECLEKAVRLRPHDAETIANFGFALRGAERPDEAIACYRRALEIDPNYAQATTNLASLYQETGKLAQALTLFARALELSPENPACHYNYGNTLFVTGQLMMAAERYEQALRLKPDYVEAMVNLGMTLSQMGNNDQSRQWLDVAATWFDKALQADPNNTVALNNLGNILRQKGEPAQAITYYRRALTVRPDYIDAIINMSISMRDVGRLDDALLCCAEAIRLQPQSVDARINAGTFLQELARHREAAALFDEALALKPTSIDAKWNQSLSLLALGDYQAGWALHEIGLGALHMRGESMAPEKRWQGENFVGKNLLLWSEQGLGDSLHFIRYAQMCKARGGRVIVMCPRSLRNLFSNAPYIDELPVQVNEEDFDLHAPLMSLPYIFGTTVDTIPTNIPYVQIGQAARAKWAGCLAGATGLKVGLVWAGNPRENLPNAHRIDRRRSMTLEMLRPLFDVPGISFVSLQMGEAATAQIDHYGLRDRLLDPMENVKNFEDTGAIIEQLDLVIAVDTSVVHLAGGLGKPVWVLSRFDACWRWLGNAPQNPWYPNARIFGQSAPGDWAGVVARVRQALAELISN